MKHKNLSDWLNYLETLHPKIIDLGLERISKVAQRLNIFPFFCPVITIAGTNGKGSCVALTESILHAAGYKVGTYTSPHLLSYNERVCINGKMVDDAALCDAFAEVEAARSDDTLTYFEFGTLAALLLFKKANLDAIILEVGMGGRLDAVNIVDADIAIISTIALDHMEWLGDDREKIGFEKAGIMRTGKPCVCGDFDVPESIKKYAKTMQATLYCQNQEFGYEYSKTTWTWWGKQQKLEHLPLPKIALQNAATVLQTIELLADKFTISPEAIETALQKVSVPGRFQIISDAVITILDVAHNPASGALLAKQLHDMPCQGRTLAVVGMLTDKDMRNTVATLVKTIDAWYVGGLHVPRGGEAIFLAEQIRMLQCQNVLEFHSITEAYQQALNDAKSGDRIIVFGSFYTVAEVMQLRL